MIHDIEVKTLIGGIDMNVGEVMLADRLREKGITIDAIYTHHPEGMALAKLDKVMAMQAEIWEDFGVPINIGEAMIDERRTEVKRRFMPVNADQAIDAARLLDIPFWRAHTPTDNLVVAFLARFRYECEPVLIEDVRKALFEMPEYKEPARAAPARTSATAPPEAGRQGLRRHDGRHRRPRAISWRSSPTSGVGTIVGMHMGPELRKAAEEHHIHVVIAGHISSDSLGINLFMDALERKGVRSCPCRA